MRFSTKETIHSFIHSFINSFIHSFIHFSLFFPSLFLCVVLFNVCRGLSHVVPMVWIPNLQDGDSCLYTSLYLPSL